MKKKSPSSSSIARRAWRLLRLSLLWAKKGKAFRNKLLLDLRPLPKYLKTLRRTASHSHRLHYNERQFSFDDSPVFHFKMHRPASTRQLHIPCFNAPAVGFDDGDSGCWHSDDTPSTWRASCRRYAAATPRNRRRSVAQARRILRDVGSRERVVEEIRAQTKLETYVKYNEIIADE